jgi:hypothetical protein
LAKYRYLLKNISKNDINLGDLIYRIPAGQTRDLLSKTAHLKLKDIIKSREKGSIGARLGKSLIEVDSVIIAKPPPISEVNSSTVKFPQRVKSSITIEVGDISEDIDNISISEDEEFLKQINEDRLLNNEEALPTVVEKKDDDTKT